MTAPTELRVAADRLIDGSGTPPVEGVEVVVRDGVIAAIEPARGDSGATRFRGATILPGIIDAHVHLSLPGDARPYEAMAQETDGQMVAHGLRNAASHLAAGVTTVRDNGSRNRVGFDIRQARGRTCRVGPSRSEAATSGGATAWRIRPVNAGPRSTALWPKAPITSRSWPVVAGQRAPTRAQRPIPWPSCERS